MAGGAGVLDCCGGCDEAAVEVTLLAAEEVPFEVTLVVAALGVRAPCAVLVVWMDWFDDDRLEPPTNRLKRWFMLDMRESYAQAKSARGQNETRLPR